MNNHKFLWLLPLFFLWGCGSNQQSETAHTFSFEMNFSYPGDPVFVYDHLTGDISSWWDHSFSENPYKLFIDARPGGGFYEIFNESGEFTDETPHIVRQVWEHFLWEQFKPYIEEHYRQH